MTKPTLKDKAYTELKKLILSGDISPGEFLAERTLEMMLGMSRTPIRGAMQRLEMEGLVNYTAGRGLAVAELSIKRASDIYDFRIALEAYVARKLCTRNWTADEIARVQEILSRQQESVKKNDLARFTEEDWEFHQTLTEIYGNKEIIQSMERIQDSLFQIAMLVLRKDADRIQISLQDHEQIFEFIVAGDSNSVVQRVTDHLEFGKRILIM